LTNWPPYAPRPNNPARRGAHLLRHSLATQLLHNGASLTKIGERLRHRDLETTRIYAKVDQGALSLASMASRKRSSIDFPVESSA
jgi:site-specific recombinase XerD